MLPLVAFLLPILLIFLGFAVDLAYMQTTRMELLAAADSAARAGAARLSQTDDVVAARSFAVEIAARNEVAGAPLQLRSSDIQVGKSVRNSAGKWVFTNGGTPANSLRVTAPRNKASRGGPVPLFFGSLIGTPSFQPVQVATASFLNVDVCLVLDRSTSMKLRINEPSGGLTDSRLCSAPNNASRWKALDDSVRVFLAELADTDAQEQIALVTYGGDGPTPFSCNSRTAVTLDAPLSTSTSAISSAMSTLSSSVWNGYTHIEGGMRSGLTALQDSRRARSSAEKIMIVMTDGHENIGSAVAAATAVASANIVIHTITFSSDSNQALMERVADMGGGRHYHADTAIELRSVFRELAAVSTVLTE